MRSRNQETAAVLGPLVAETAGTTPGSAVMDLYLTVDPAPQPATWPQKVDGLEVQVVQSVWTALQMDVPVERARTRTADWTLEQRTSSLIDNNEY